MKKRFWALFLAVMMIVSVLPTTIFAEGETVGNGLQPDPLYYSFEGKKVNEKDADITLSKTAEYDTETGEYTITLSADAKAKIQPKLTKVIFVLDASYSMSACTKSAKECGHDPQRGTSCKTTGNDFSDAQSRWRIATNAIAEMKTTLGTTGIEYYHVLFGNNGALTGNNGQNPYGNYPYGSHSIQQTYLMSGVDAAVDLAMGADSKLDPDTNYAMIIVSDGAATDSHYTSAKYEQFKEQGGEVYAIGFTFSNSEFKGMVSLSNYKDAGSANELNVALGEIAKNIIGLITDPMGDDVTLNKSTVNVTAGKPGADVAKDSTINWTDPNGLEGKVELTYKVEIDPTTETQKKAGSVYIRLNGDATLNYSYTENGQTYEKSILFPVPVATIQAATLDVIYLDDDGEEIKKLAEHEWINLTASGKFSIHRDIPDVGEPIGEYWVADVKFVDFEAEELAQPDAEDYTIIVTLTAEEPDTEANYTVMHWFETLNPTGEAEYEQLEAYPDETKSGNIGEVTEAEAKTVTGFTAQAFEQGKIADDGSTVVNIYYDRNSYTVTYDYESDVPGQSDLPATESYKYGASVTVADAATAPGYTFSGWSQTGTFTMPAENVTITGSWIKLVTLTFDANGGGWGNPEDVAGFTLNEGNNIATKVSEVSYTLDPITQPTRGGYKFTGWYNKEIQSDAIGLGGQTLYMDLTLYADWEEVQPDDVKYTVRKHYIGAEGTEVAAVNLIDHTAKEGTAAATIIANYAQNQTYYGQNYVYAAGDTAITGAGEGNVLINGTVIDLYYYLDTWNDEKNTINEGDDIPDMYQAVVKFQAGDLYGTVEGTGIVQVFTLNAEKAADSISGQITPSVEDVNVVPNEGYAFDIWTMNDGETGVNPEAPITVQGGSTTNFYAHFALDKIGGVNGGDGTPDKYQALVTYKVVNGTWSNGSSADIVKVFTLQKKNNDGVWADVAAVLGAMPTGMKPAAGYMTIGAWNKTHAADERPVHASVYTWTFTTRNAPDVTIAKYANKTSATVGETITYTIIVTNTGNVALTDLVVKDVFTQGGNGETVWTIASLAPGASQKIEFSYRTSNHDVGGLKNIAVVTGKGPDGGEVTDITQSVETDVYREHIVRPTRPALNKEDHYAYIVGYPDGMVHPERNITRAEVSTIFFRMLLDESREDFWAQENWFSDVPADQWYNNAVSTLSNAGLITGYPDGSFKPNANITRAEFATIAIRFFLEEDVEITENNLTDVKGHWAEANINLAYALNLITGYPDNTFRPDQKITRAEAMTIVNRVLERAPHKDHLLDDMIEWPDNMDTDAWYYADVQEATNSHEFYKTEIKGEDEEYEIWTELLPVRDWAALERMWSEANSSKNPGEVVDINISTPEASN